MLQRFKRFRERLNKSSKLWSTHIRADLDPLLDLVEEMQSLTERRLSEYDQQQERILGAIRHVVEFHCTPAQAKAILKALCGDDTKEEDE